jgi:carbon monoxide dehydrogenase subunit G
VARYRTTVTSPLSSGEAFAYLADLEHFAEWDPGVISARRVEGTEPAVGSAYDVTVRSIGRGLTLRYEIVDHRPPREMRVVARTSTLTSDDKISVAPRADGGCDVTYDARLDLRGPLRLFDPLLGLAFGRIGDRAAAGLRRALQERRA